MKVLVEGKRRARSAASRRPTTSSSSRSRRCPTSPERSVEIDALMREVHATFETYVKLNKRIPPEILISVQTIDDPGQLADTIVGQLQLKLADKQSILEMDSPSKRLERLYELMQAEIEILQVEKKIRTRVKKQMEKTQKEYYLNEQMQAIQKELGDRDEFKNEMTELEDRAKQKNLSKEAQAKVKKELKKLKMMAPMSAEATVVRNYIDWVLALPWDDKTEEKLDVVEAERILDEDHYGLKKVKERILEYLAVQALVKKLKGPILCLVGPPGVGKTSLARSIAQATGRNFVRLSLGGVRDEAEIRGHRRTYIGALPGKIIQSLKKAGTNNPVFLLDEIDKMSTDFRGDPSAALLEVLDPEQNAHVQRSLPRSRLRPLRRHVHHDGELPAGDPGAAAGPHGDHPAPRLHRVREGLDRRAVPDPQAEARERRRGRPGRLPRGRGPRRHPPLHEGGGRPEPRARDRDGVPQDRARRGRQEGARAHVSDGTTPGWRITPKRLPRYLGPHRFRYGRQEGATRSAWSMGWRSPCTAATSSPPRCRSSPGKGKLVLTGKLGDVMQESAQAAMSYVRSRAPSLGLERDFYSRADIHVHFPEGAIPKDGPSAGVTMCTGAGVGAAAHPGAPRRGDDRRDHAARARAADRRPQGEDPRRSPRGHHDRDHAEGERQGPARHPEAGAEVAEGHPRRAHGRGAARGAGAARTRRSSSTSRRCRSTGASRSSGASERDRRDEPSRMPVASAVPPPSAREEAPDIAATPTSRRHRSRPPGSSPDTNAFPFPGRSRASASTSVAGRRPGSLVGSASVSGRGRQSDARIAAVEPAGLEPRPRSGRRRREDRVPRLSVPRGHPAAVPDDVHRARPNGRDGQDGRQAAGDGGHVYRAPDRRHLRLVPHRRADVGWLPVVADGDHRPQSPDCSSMTGATALSGCARPGEPGGDALVLVLRAARALGPSATPPRRERPAVPRGARARAPLPPAQHPRADAVGGAAEASRAAIARWCSGTATRWRSSVGRCRSRIRRPFRPGFVSPCSGSSWAIRPTRSSSATSPAPGRESANPGMMAPG